MSPHISKNQGNEGCPRGGQGAARCSFFAFGSSLFAIRISLTHISSVWEMWATGDPGCLALPHEATAQQSGHTDTGAEQQQAGGLGDGIRLGEQLDITSAVVINDQPLLRSVVEDVVQDAGEERAVIAAGGEGDELVGGADHRIKAIGELDVEGAVEVDGAADDYHAKAARVDELAEGAVGELVVAGVSGSAGADQQCRLGIESGLGGAGEVRGLDGGSAGHAEGALVDDVARLKNIAWRKTEGASDFVGEGAGDDERAGVLADIALVIHIAVDVEGRTVVDVDSAGVADGKRPADGSGGGELAVFENQGPFDAGEFVEAIVGGCIKSASENESGIRNHIGDACGLVGEVEHFSRSVPMLVKVPWTVSVFPPNALVRRLP